MLRGVDVSHWQGNLNLNTIAYDFVIAKATGGTGYVDDQCDRFIQQAIGAGKKFGFYHYYSDGFGGDNPIAEADFFVDNCLGYFKKGIPVLDWEAGGNSHWRDTNYAKQFLDHVYNRTGVKPIIYMSLSLVRGLDWSAVIAGNYGLWCAAYVDNNTPIPNYQMDPARDPNPHWDGNVNDVLWQFTSTGRLDGYGGNLDCNFFYGNGSTWDAYAQANTAPTPEPTTTTTTTLAPTPPDPEPTTTTTTIPPTTTTTTEQPEPPEPSPTTTTTTQGGSQPTPGQSFWVGFWLGVGALFTAIYKWFKGEKK